MSKAKKSGRVKSGCFFVVFGVVNATGLQLLTFFALFHTFFALFHPDPLHRKNKVYIFVLSNAKDNRKKEKKY